MSRKKVLVTGGLGFLGAAMVRRLVSEGNDVHVIAKASTSTARVADILARVSLHHEDLGDRDALRSLIARLRPEGIFHFAASNIQSGVTAGDDEVIRTNVLGTANLLAACADVDYDFFIHSGSFMECGKQDHAQREDDTPRPTDLYSISKLAGTLAVAAAGASGKPTIALRIFTPYGPQMQRGRLVYEVVRKALAGEPLQLAAPEITRDFVFIDDIVELCLEAAKKARTCRGEIFNAGTGTKTSLKELVALVRSKTNTRSEVKWGDFGALSYDSDMWQADMSKTFATFDWRPRVSLDEGIDHMIRALKS